MLKDQEFANQILNTIGMLTDASIELYRFISEESAMQALKFAELFEQMIKSLEIPATMVVREQPFSPLEKCRKSILASFLRIKNFILTNPEKALHKIEFELLPMTKGVYQLFYFQGCVYPDKGRLKKYYEEEMIPLSANHYIDQAMETGKYKYTASIVVLAYNKLEYTKMCVESLLKYIPDDLNYELILINHGSNDGTKEYFESIKPHKQLDIEVNGGGCDILFRIIEGEFILGISNDVLVTENAIQMLLDCMQSDPKIGWAVPTTPNVSNLQTIPGNYRNIDEMYNFAKVNNQPDLYRYEQRTRLCNPIDLRRSSIWCSRHGVGNDSYFLIDAVSSFPDDKISLLLRRNGYKSILVKNAYCYHFGSVTLKDEITAKNEEEHYLKGRKAFKKTFGIDPWGTGFCYDPYLMNALSFSFEGSIKILGINCGLGSDPLKIKETYKELRHNLDAHILNITDNESYIEDLKGVGDEALLVSSMEECMSAIKDKKFHYIVWEDPFRKPIDSVLIIDSLLKHLHKDGVLAYDTSLVKMTKSPPNTTKKSVNEWTIIRQKK